MIIIIKICLSFHIIMYGSWFITLFIQIFTPVSKWDKFIMILITWNGFEIVCLGSLTMKYMSILNMRLVFIKTLPHDPVIKSLLGCFHHINVCRAFR